MSAGHLGDNPKPAMNPQERIVKRHAPEVYVCIQAANVRAAASAYPRVVYSQCTRLAFSDLLDGAQRYLKSKQGHLCGTDRQLTAVIADVVRAV